MPDAGEIDVAYEFSLRPQTVQDALRGHSWGKLERFGDTLFVALRPAWCVDDGERVKSGERVHRAGLCFVR